MFHGSASRLSLRPDWTFDLDDQTPALGAAVASAGDLDADGYDDILVSAPSVNAEGLADLVAVLIFHGSPSGLTATATTTDDEPDAEVEDLKESG